METIIYFFSGTGNSLWLARKTAQHLSAGIIPIASTLNMDAINITVKNVGIVTPVYYGDLPNIVKVFLGKLRNIENKYIFMVVNYGGGLGHSVAAAKRIVKAKRGKISALYSIHMPQNSFCKPSENSDQLYNAADQLLSAINKNVSSQKQGVFSTNRGGDCLQGFLYFTLKAAYRKHLLHLSSLGAEATVEEAIYQADATFAVNDKCNGCGICVQVCPVANIQLLNDKPEWLHHCENCLACYNCCPQQAIHGPLVEENHYYRHPEVRITDLIKQKQGIMT